MWLEGYVEAQLGFDAAHCPNPVPPGYRWCMVYAGGSSATHAWDDQELQLVAHLPRLPVWVPTPGSDNPHTAAEQLIDWLAAHGVPAATQPTDPRVHVMWDMETGKEPDPTWANLAADDLDQAGYSNLVYGSKATLFGQPRRDGYVVADPTGVAHLYPRPGVRATQYAFDVQTPGGTIDQDAMERDLVSGLWLPAA